MKLTKYIIGGLAALALVGCKDKMRELNTNPDTIGNTDPQYMFLSAMSDFDNDSRGAVTEKWSAGTNMQYFVYYAGAGDGTYCDPQTLMTKAQPTLPRLNYYYSWYKGKGYNMVSIMNYIDNDLDEITAQRYQDLRAICGIVKVYEAFRIFQNYGANVYTQAFKAISDGITLPEYDIFDNEMYEALDDELAGYIAVLEQPDNGNYDLGVYDPIYGYKLPDGAPVLGAPATRGNYAEQRTLWKKFANSYRLYMAWIMKNADPARFDQVLSETFASGVFEGPEDGAYTYLNGGNNNGGIYNCAEAADLSTRYSVSDNFVAYLKNLDDPRLPLLARSNNLFEANPAMQWIRNYFPDSLDTHQVYNDNTKTWSEESWNGVWDFWADPELAYQGQSPNPYDADKTNAGKFWGKSTFTLRFYCPGYKPGDDTYNDNLGPWTVTNKGVVSEDYPATWEIQSPDTSFSIEVGSRPQNRYFVPGGGSQYGWYDGQSRNGFDGTVDDRWNIYLRQPLYTYPEFCFMMAYLTLDGVNTGKSAQEWYESGVTTAMEELQGDAIRANIQVATNLEHTYEEPTYGFQFINPEVQGINSDGVYSITDKIAPYVQSVALASFSDQKAAVVGQMWIYAYMNPTKMWDWWRLTGYPEIIPVETPADRPNNRLPYWVEPHANADKDQILEWPRRVALPQPEAANNTNYNNARNELLKQPNYGTEYNQNTGRIYWDTQGL